MAQWHRICLPMQETQVWSLSQEGRKWRRKWQPTPVFVPGKFHEQRNLAGLVHGVPKSRTWLSNSAHTHRHTHTWLYTYKHTNICFRYENFSQYPIYKNFTTFCGFFHFLNNVFRGTKAFKFKEVHFSLFYLVHHANFKNTSTDTMTEL